MRLIKSITLVKGNRSEFPPDRHYLRVEGVQTNRDVVAWMIELNECHMLYWASWWVANFTDRLPVQDLVNRAIMRALHEAGVIMPYPKGRFEFDSHDGSCVAPGTANETKD